MCQKASLSAKRLKDFDCAVLIFKTNIVSHMAKTAILVTLRKHVFCINCSCFATSERPCIRMFCFCYAAGVLCRCNSISAISPAVMSFWAQVGDEIKVHTGYVIVRDSVTVIWLENCTVNDLWIFVIVNFNRWSHLRSCMYLTEAHMNIWSTSLMFKIDQRGNKKKFQFDLTTDEDFPHRLPL